MTTQKLLWKITRPEASALCFASAWCLATISEAPSDLRLYVSIVSGLSCFGASVFHYGANSKVYIRKSERVEIKRPWLLAAIGFAALISANLISLVTDNVLCIAAASFNTVAISGYASVLSKRWFSKNLIIAVVCTTPAIMGWLVGTITHPATIYLLTDIFFTFLAREIIKDVIDIKANHGIRVTLPMVVGISGALIIAAGATVVGAVASLLLYRYLWSGVIASCILAFVAWQLLITREPRRAHSIIMVSMSTLILSFM